jgi:hypothetical protein
MGEIGVVLTYVYATIMHSANYCSLKRDDYYIILEGPARMMGWSLLFA